MPKGKQVAGKPPMHLLEREFLEGTARALGFGNQKYAAFDYRDGTTVSQFTAAAMRHLVAFMDGEDIDPESGLPHLWHLGGSVNVLCYLARYRPKADDRPGHVQSDVRGVPGPHNADRPHSIRSIQAARRSKTNGHKR